jgi:hypothetical protein
MAGERKERKIRKFDMLFGFRTQKGLRVSCVGGVNDCLIAVLDGFILYITSVLYNKKKEK